MAVSNCRQPSQLYFPKEKVKGMERTKLKLKAIKMAEIFMRWIK
jgi:hypothetical protein